MRNLARRLLREVPSDPYQPSDPRLRAEIEAAIAQVRPHTMVSAAGLTSLYEQARHCEQVGLDGAFVECGVWHGGAGALMALANLAHGRARRPLHLFDSFAGIPEPVAGIDGSRAVSEVGIAKNAVGGELHVAYDYGDRGGPGSTEAVSDLLASVGYPAEDVHLHVGWFQDTVPVADTGPIAILRLDGDWYESTRVCLEHLYERVVPGGFVIVDDYGTYDGCRLAVDEHLAALPQRPFLSRVNQDIRYLVRH